MGIGKIFQFLRIIFFIIRRQRRIREGNNSTCYYSCNLHPITITATTIIISILMKTNQGTELFKIHEYLPIYLLYL